MTTASENTVKDIRQRRSLPPQLRQSRRSPVVGVAFVVLPSEAEELQRPKVTGRPHEHARPDAPRILDRNSSRQHHPHPHRQERFRSEHHVHRLPPDRRRRIEHHLRSHHHRRRWATPITLPTAAEPSISSAAACPTSAKPRLTLIRPCSISPRSASASRRPTHRQRRRRFRRRQKHLLRRSRQRPAAEAHHPRQGRSHQHHGPHVEGDPPIKPVSQYTVIGKSHRTPSPPPKSPPKKTGPPTCAFPKCSMRAWSIRKLSAPRSSPPAQSTKPNSPTRKSS